jgi:hypothetical protein
LQAGYFSQKQAETSPLTSPVASGNPTDTVVSVNNMAMTFFLNVYQFNFKLRLLSVGALIKKLGMI